MSSNKYAKMPKIELTDRKWPSAELTENPSWCAVDLRDGNQALPDPMTPEQKKQYFNLLLDIGFKEIEIGFPAASHDDFQFCRDLIEQNMIPDDVVISVLTQSRPALITKTLEALRGVKRAVVHAYIATSELHMKYVFGSKEEDVIKTAVDAVKQIKSEAAELKGSEIGLEFSPEEFTDTDIDFAVEISNKVVEAWDPSEGEKVIINLPMTVERRLPNEYADMIEYYNKHNKYPDKTIVSIHAHNDMGCAVAASTQALMAGANRIEGTLLGHGERTGNVDLITMALNLQYIGIDTGLDFRNLPDIVNVIEEISKIKVHERHPYAGKLVFTAFSGSHQDAIHKGFTSKDTLAERFGGWKIPYLHVDPKSLGRSFEKYIRINSQSGKGGIAFVLENDYNISLPKWVQADFAKHVQEYADKESRELSSKEVYDIFNDTYLKNGGALELINYWPRPTEDEPKVIKGELHVNYNNKKHELNAEGNGPISAAVNALKQLDTVPDFVLEEYAEDSMGHSADATAISFVKIKRLSDNKIVIGCGQDANVIQAAVRAVLSGINKLV
jgi:2-isopropylmalate synthase